MSLKSAAGLARTELLLDGLQQVVRRGNEFSDSLFLSPFQQYPHMTARFSYIDRETRQAVLWSVMSRIATTYGVTTAQVRLFSTSVAVDEVPVEDYRVFATVLLEIVRAFEGDGFTTAMAGAWSEVLTDASFA
jgi:hypothetical protein